MLARGRRQGRHGVAAVQGFLQDLPEKVPLAGGVGVRPVEVLQSQGRVVADPLEEAQEGEAAPPAQATLETFGYTMAIRGNYNQMKNFLEAMFSSRELVEILSIELQNENGPTRAGGSTSMPVDYSRPIKMIATMRLVLQPAL